MTPPSQPHFVLLRTIFRIAALQRHDFVSPEGGTFPPLNNSQAKLVTDVLDHFRRNIAAPHLAPPAREAISEMKRMTGEQMSRVLIVDDDPYFLRVLSRILSGENFQVKTAEGATEAAQILKQDTFDIVISDLRLPDGDGLSILQEVRKGGREVPVVILTAYGEVDSYLEAMNAGATEYLNKPVKSEDLISVVRSCLRGRAATSGTTP